MKHWSRRGAIAWLLWPVSLLFGFLVLARRILYWARILSSRHPGIPVIVVGNLTVGGTGKTPLVAWLSMRLSGAGMRVAIVSRGYGGRARGVTRVTVLESERAQAAAEATEPSF